MIHLGFGASSEGQVRPVPCQQGNVFPTWHKFPLLKFSIASSCSRKTSLSPLCPQVLTWAPRSIPFMSPCPIPADKTVKGTHTIFRTAATIMGLVYTVLGSAQSHTLRNHPAGYNASTHLKWPCRNLRHVTLPTPRCQFGST